MLPPRYAYARRADTLLIRCLADSRCCRRYAITIDIDLLLMVTLRC